MEGGKSEDQIMSGQKISKGMREGFNKSQKSRASICLTYKLCIFCIIFQDSGTFADYTTS